MHMLHCAYTARWPLGRCTLHREARHTRPRRIKRKTKRKCATLIPLIRLWSLARGAPLSTLLQPLHRLNEVFPQKPQKELECAHDLYRLQYQRNVWIVFFLLFSRRGVGYFRFVSYMNRESHGRNGKRPVASRRAAAPRRPRNQNNAQ